MLVIDLLMGGELILCGAILYLCLRAAIHLCAIESEEPLRYQRTYEACKHVACRWWLS